MLLKDFITYRILPNSRLLHIVPFNTDDETEALRYEEWEAAGENSETTQSVRVLVLNPGSAIDWSCYLGQVG